MILIVTYFFKDQVKPLIQDRGTGLYFSQILKNGYNGNANIMVSVWFDREQQNFITECLLISTNVT